MLNKQIGKKTYKKLGLVDLLRKKLGSNSSKKLSRKKQQYLLKLLGELLVRGLSLQEALLFIHCLNEEYTEITTVIQEHLERGHRLDEAFAELHFSEMLVSQI